MDSNILVAEDYVKILQEKLKTSNIEFKSVEWAPISENLEGYVGEHYIIKIFYNAENTEGEEIFFLKTKPTKSDFQKVMANDYRTYKKEIFFYDHLLKEFRRMGFNTSFAPTVYYCKNFDSIVLEDLKARDFKLITRATFFDLDHCKAVLKALAYFHANSIAYEETKSEELGRRHRIIDENPEVFEEFIMGDKYFFKFFTSTLQCLKHIVGFLSEPEEWKQATKTKLSNFDVGKTFNTQLPSRKTCCHGDLWSNNIFFKYTNGVPRESCLVDFQLLRYHHPAYDVCLAIYLNTSRSFRKHHLGELLDFYYEAFREILQQYSLEAERLLPKEQFLESANVLKSVVLTHSAAVRILLFLPEQKKTSLPADEEFKAMMFDEKCRSKLAEEWFHKDENYRNVLIDDIFDFSEHL